MNHHQNNNQDMYMSVTFMWKSGSGILRPSGPIIRPRWTSPRCGLNCSDRPGVAYQRANMRRRSNKMHQAHVLPLYGPLKTKRGCVQKGHVSTRSASGAVTAYSSPQTGHRSRRENMGSSSVEVLNFGNVCPSLRTTCVQNDRLASRSSCDAR